MRKKYLLLLLVALAMALGGCKCDKKHFAPPPEPNAPSNLIARVVSYKQIHLSWQDNSDDEDYFRVCCPTMFGTQHQTIATLAPNTTSFLHQGLQPMTEYEYYVCVHRREERACSERAYATTPCPVEIRYSWMSQVSNRKVRIEGILENSAVEDCLVELTAHIYDEEGDLAGIAVEKFFIEGIRTKPFVIIYQIVYPRETEKLGVLYTDYTLEITDVEIEY